MSRSLIGVTGRRLLLALVPILVVLAIPGVVQMWQRPEDGLSLRHRTVMQVQPGSPGALAGLRAHDRILAVDGRPVSSSGNYLHELTRHRPGDTMRWLIERDGVAGEVQATLQPSSLASRMRHVMLTLIAFCVLWLGFFSYWRRNDPLGRWFHLSCALLAYNLIDLPTFPWPPVIRALEAMRDASQLFWAAAFLRFAWIFPEGVRERPELHRRRRWVLLLPSLLAPLNLLIYLEGSRWFERPLTVLVQSFMAVVVFGYLVFALWILFRKATRKHRWETWSKLRLALLGIVAGFLPFLLVSIFRLFWPTQPLALDMASLLFLPLAPAGFSLAMTRSGAVDLSQLTRQALIALLIGPPLLVLLLVAVQILDSEAAPGRLGIGLGITVALTLAIALGLAPLRALAARAVDQWIYPEPRRIRAEAKALGEILSRQREAVTLAERMCEGLCNLVQARSASIYLRRGEAFELIASREQDAARPPLPSSLPDSATLLARVLRDEQMLVLPPLLSGRRPLRLDGPSRDLLSASDAEIGCPLIAGGEALAILWLGPSVTQRDYGAVDLFHIEQLSRLAAASLDSALLHESDLARERMKTELNLAREIQSKLLPEGDLQAGDIYVCGRMASSREIGGDLYDHHVLADGRIMLCVADATGKGVPASLLISSVRTAVRDAVRPGIGAEEAVGQLAGKVFEMTGSEHFVAMFLGLLDPRSGILEYCVAGIEPPLWLHGGSGRMEQLSRGGAPLGLSAEMRYRSGLIRLEPGDVLLAYSDGMIDQEDPNEDYFGLERLRGSLAELAGSAPVEIADRLMGALEAFGPGDPTDDRTLLLLKWQQKARPGMEDAMH